MLQQLSPPFEENFTLQKISTKNFQLHSANCFSAPLLTRKNFAKERKKQCARLPSPHTPSHTQTTLLHFLRQLDRFAQTPALRTLSTWQVVVQKERRKTKTKLNRQPRRLLVSAISACMHIPACMCSHGSLSIWHGHFPLSIRPSHSTNNNF
jgi:hypothetical protein